MILINTVNNSLMPSEATASNKACHDRVNSIMHFDGKFFSQHVLCQNCRNCIINFVQV